jgi:hypothetical protein
MHQNGAKALSEPFSVKGIKTLFRFAAAASVAKALT